MNHTSQAYGQTGFIVAMATITYFLTGFIEHSMPANILTVILNIMIFVMTSTFVSWHYNILSFKDFILRLIGRMTEESV